MPFRQGMTHDLESADHAIAKPHISLANIIVSTRLIRCASHGASLPKGKAVIVVGIIVVTDWVNGWLLIDADNLLSLLSTLYGKLLLAKLMLFGVMLALALLNRCRLTSDFERSIAAADHGGALAALRRSLAIEVISGVTALGPVAWLGTLGPLAPAM